MLLGVKAPELAQKVCLTYETLELLVPAVEATSQNSDTREKEILSPVTDSSIESGKLTDGILASGADHCPYTVLTSQILSLRLEMCGTLSNSNVVTDAGEDRTGLFVWRGAREFLHFWSRILFLAADRAHACGKASATAKDDLCDTFPFSASIELGAGSGIGSLAIAAAHTATRSLFPGSTNVAVIATDYWLPALKLIERNAMQLTKSCDVHGEQCTEVVTCQLDWTDFLSNTTDDGMSPYPTDVLQRTKHLPCEETLLSFLPTDFPHRRQRTWLFGLDVVYPSTAPEVLLGFCQCVRHLLLTLAPPVFESLFTGAFTCSFVERDGGRTLCRLIRTCQSTGLTVLPLSSPFKSTSDPPFTGAERFYFASLYAEQGDHSSAQSSVLRQLCSAVWDTFSEDVVRNCPPITATDALVLNEKMRLDAVGGSWLLALLPTSDEEAHTNTCPPREWTERCPWMWHPTLSVADAAACCVSVPTENGKHHVIVSDSLADILHLTKMSTKYEEECFLHDFLL